MNITGKKAILSAILIGGVLTLTAPANVASADSGYATNCGPVSYGVQRNIDMCYQGANFEQDASKRASHQATCNKMVKVGNQLIRWCNNNINKCKQNYVAWYFNADTINTGVGHRWEASCAYGLK